VPFYQDSAPLFDKNKSRGQLTAKEVILKINAFSFGDTLCATPILRKLALAYAKKIVVCSSKPSLFKNNPYVKFHISHDEFKDGYNEQYEVFNTFNSIGKADKTGIERRYSEFDMRRCHAADCGMDLLPQEMTCDYYPDPVEFKDGEQKFINNNEYVVIHIAKNWPSRTWGKKSYEAFCASNAKWSVVEHGSSNSIPPLPECLEGRPTFECHPSPDKVFTSTLSVLK
jgi:hypothetical protein